MEEIALAALTHGTVRAADRATFGPGEAKALAIDAHDGIAAVLVIRRRHDDAWIVDVVKFVDEGGAWSGLGSGGGTYGNLPIDPDPHTTPSLGPTVTSRSLLDGHGLATVGGFVIGEVGAVEIVLGDRSRRVPVMPGSTAFVVAVLAREDDDLDVIDVRVFDRLDAIVDSTAARYAKRPGITVAEALGLPDGTPATVRGLLIALSGEQPMLCDDVDDERPPQCVGQGIRLELDAPLPPTIVEDGGVSMLTMVVSGVVRDGVLTPTE